MSMGYRRGGPGYQLQPSRGSRVIQQMGFAGPMGTSCQPGYYDLFGLCVPNLATAVTGAEKGVAASAGTGLISSPVVQQQAQAAAASSLGTSVINFYKNNPIMAWGLTAGVIAMIAYGGLSFLKK